MQFGAVLDGSSLFFDDIIWVSGIQEHIGKLFRLQYCGVEGVMEVGVDVWTSLI